MLRTSTTLVPLLVLLLRVVVDDSTASREFEACVTSKGASIDVKEMSVHGKMTNDGDATVLDILNCVDEGLSTSDLDETTTDNSLFNFVVDNFALYTNVDVLRIGTKNVVSWTLQSNFMTLSDVSAIVFVRLDLADKVSVSYVSLAGVWQVNSDVRLNLKIYRVDSTYYIIRASRDESDLLLPVDSFIRHFVSDFSLSELAVPPGISNPITTLHNMRVLRYSFSTKRPNCIGVILRPDEPVDVVPGIVRLVNPFLFINVTLSTPRVATIKMNGAWNFDSTRLPVSIDPAAKGFYLTGRGTDSISVQSIVNKFDADYIPSALESALEKASMSNFAIESPSFKIPLETGAKGFRCYIAGRPVIDGWSEVTFGGVSAVVDKGTATNKAALVVGFEIAKAKIVDIVEKLTDVRVKPPPPSLLDQSTKVAFAISSRDVDDDDDDDVRLEGQILSQISLRSGLSIVASFALPSDCEKDSFCKYAKDAFGANVRIAATITSPSRLFIPFSAPGVDINVVGPKLVLSRVSLDFTLGKVASHIEIRATLSLARPRLTFVGSIQVGNWGLGLVMTMKGTWKRAFGVDFLTLDSGAIAAMNLDSGVGLRSIKLYGEMTVGKRESGREIVAIVQAGIDPADPERNDFQGLMNKVTIDSILKALDIDLTLPSFLRTSTFLDGLQVHSVERRHPSGMVVPKSVVLKGAIYILGSTQQKALVEINLPRGIRIIVRMDPLFIGARIKMYGSAIESPVGPLLVADVTTLPLLSKVNVAISGYVNFFHHLFWDKIVLQITDREFVFWMRTDLFLYHNVLLKFYAPYGSFRGASFRVRGSFPIELIAKLEYGVQTFMMDVSEAAAEAVSAVTKKRLDRARLDFNEARRNVLDVKKKRDTDCKIRLCPTSKCFLKWRSSLISGTYACTVVYEEL